MKVARDVECAVSTLGKPVERQPWVQVVKDTESWLRGPLGGKA